MVKSSFFERASNRNTTRAKLRDAARREPDKTLPANAPRVSAVGVGLRLRYDVF
jgi:hypothetical protein